MRKRRAVKRDVLPDPIYNSKVVTKLINQIMKDGKKGTAERIINEAFALVKEKTKEEQEIIRHGLLVYCELDTFAMVKLWQKFKEIIGE